MYYRIKDSYRSGDVYLERILKKVIEIGTVSVLKDATLFYNIMEDIAPDKTDFIIWLKKNYGANKLNDIYEEYYQNSDCLEGYINRIVDEYSEHYNIYPLPVDSKTDTKKNNNSKELKYCHDSKKSSLFSKDYSVSNIDIIGDRKYHQTEEADITINNPSGKKESQKTEDKGRKGENKRRKTQISNNQTRTKDKSPQKGKISIIYLFMFVMLLYSLYSLGEKTENNNSDFNTFAGKKTLEHESTVQSTDDIEEKYNLSNGYLLLKNPPFYGIWCLASQEYTEAEEYAQYLQKKGIEGYIVKTSDWDNLNPEPWYAVTAGIYPSEIEASNELNSIIKIYPSAYIKYSGEWSN